MRECSAAHQVGSGEDLVYPWKEDTAERTKAVGSVWSDVTPSKVQVLGNGEITVQMFTAVVSVLEHNTHCNNRTGQLATCLLLVEPQALLDEESKLWREQVLMALCSGDSMKNVRERLQRDCSALCIYADVESVKCGAIHHGQHEWRSSAGSREVASMLGRSVRACRLLMVVGYAFPLCESGFLSVKGKVFVEGPPCNGRGFG